MSSQLAATQTLLPTSPSALQRACLGRVLGLFEEILRGRLSVALPDGSRRDFGREGGPEAELRVRDYRFFTRALFEGDIGFGESYQAGEWDSPDMAALIRLFIENEEAFAARYMRLAGWGRLRDRLRHLLRANTLSGSRRNIKAHYDLSNEMFGLFLDESMTYSCAMFERPGQGLAEAQRAKRLAIARKARLESSDHVLEIGCGWGGFAIEAARETGCRVTGITLSQRQLEYARARVREAGLEGKVAIELCDYRSIPGRFDKIVSIEMLEAVGHENFDSFFAACERLLGPDGLAVLQVITIPDHRYEAYRRGCDWIQKHIFPGSLLPSLSALSSAMTRSSRLMVEHLENIGVHYARTLREWRARFMAAGERIRGLGFGPEFVRTWEYYFCYCEAAFGARTLNDIQLVLTRPNNKRLPAAAGCGGAAS